MKSFLFLNFIAIALSSPSPRQNIQCPPFPSPLPTWQQLSPQSTLPDPFLPLSSLLTNTNTQKTNRTSSHKEWFQCRQPEIIRLLQEYQFGFYPDPSQETVSATRSGNTLTITVTGPGNKKGTFKATLQIPSGANATKKAPVVLSLGGGIPSQSYLQAGIAIVQVDYMGVAADSNAKTGAFWSIYNGRDIGVLTAWAWSLHRTLDALPLTTPELNPLLSAVTGCSRLGKAALAAGLFDPRITITIPMSSGIQGLGPYRYSSLSGQGETLENSKQGAGWWTSSTLSKFMGHSEHLPFDAHTIAAAIAPRALIIDQGVGDQFVNSKGTATVVFPAAKIVYDWLGVGDKIGINVRSGGHCDGSGYNGVLPFLQRQFFGTPTTRDYHSLGSYGAALSSAFPWGKDIPPTE
ncbi:4-O-methyl-glucuronoyl methylesterase [Podospora fimiseda]|uniref:(4-O-methyl)-D-glucuronate--lignin esterase n=1 Tax=Podospora fimiseda TaxID=252190 RepID=A0AAN7H5C1_9PEZI|nr:4-O-methyl-glucuronoyl methylesterase [Podospora fimiseda]